MTPRILTIGSITQIFLLWNVLLGWWPQSALAEEKWTEITTKLLEKIKQEGLEPAWPGGCSGVILNRRNGEITVKVVGHGFWRSDEEGDSWTRIDEGTISGRDETGWATHVDQADPNRIVSFSLDGTAGWTLDGKQWTRFADLGRNWDYGSVHWGEKKPATIIAAKHETEPPGEVYVSTDAGETWQQLSIHLLKERGKISMLGAMGGGTLIYSIGEGIKRSTDFGKNWTKVSDSNPQTRVPVYFQETYYLGTDSGLLVSTDQGGTWKKQGDSVNIWLGPFFGENEKQMLVVGKAGVFRTKDQGESWTRVADLKPKDQGFLFTPNWFGCYAWDPIKNALYASSMGNQVFRLKLKD